MFLKKTLFTMLLMVSIGLVMEAQEKRPCPTCSNLNNEITDNGDNTFTALSSQAYYWSICGSGISIVGSNTGQTVEITSSGAGAASQLRLTRFINGNCLEACLLTTAVIVQVDCFPDPDFKTKNECGEGTGNVWLNNWFQSSEPIASVTYEFLPSLNNGFFSNFNFDGPDPLITTKYNSNFLALYEFEDGDCPPGQGFDITFRIIIEFDDPNCETIDEIFVIEDEFGTNPISISPNPSLGSGQIYFERSSSDKISEVHVYNIFGKQVLKTIPINKSFKIQNLKKGMYFIRFKTVHGDILQQKLIIE